MIALAMSGGANRGAIQAGALIALTEQNIVPHLVTGTSSGALNGAVFCAMPNELGLNQLADLWRNTKREDVWPGNPISWAWRQILGALGFIPKPLGLVDYKHLLSYIEEQMDYIFNRHDLIFGDLAIPLLVTGVDEIQREFMVLGHSPQEPLAISIAASAAMPGISDPVPHKGTLITDGGVVSPLPIILAANAGADEIWALDLSGFDYPYTPNNILEQLVALFDCQQNALATKEIKEAMDRNITLHHLIYEFDVGIMDFSKAQAMIEYGYQKTLEYLGNPQPLRIKTDA